jgi:probable phosphoglycerate mutase
MERLRERFEGERIDAIYSSDLSRASTTATALSKPRKLPIHKTEQLREVGLGVWEDTSWGDIGYHDHEMNVNFNHDPARWDVHGSEAYDNVKSRMYSFITETANNHDGETIAFFSHGFAIRALMCHLEGFPSHETDKMPYCDNTAVTLFIYDEGELKIEFHSDNSHLTNEQSTMAGQTWWRTEKKWAPENLRYMPLNEVCSDELLRIFRANAGERAHVDAQYAAFLADEPVGIVGLDTKRDRKSGIGWISYVHVIPLQRNKTFGTQLLGLAISDFRKLRRRKLRIEIPSGSLGINFMVKYGFNVLDVSDKTCLMEKDIRNW